MFFHCILLRSTLMHINTVTVSGNPSRNSKIFEQVRVHQCLFWSGTIVQPSILVDTAPRPGGIRCVTQRSHPSRHFCVEGTWPAASVLDTMQGAHCMDTPYTRRHTKSSLGTRTWFGAGFGVALFVFGEVCGRFVGMGLLF